MNVLVTGGRGFIGSHAVKALVGRGHKVTVYDISEGNNILDSTRLEDEVVYFRPEAIVHLAGQVHLQPSLDRPGLDAETNIVGAINVLEVARKYNCKVIFSSSGAVYGNNDRSRVTEEHDKEPMSPYGVSKRSAEIYVLLYNDLYGMEDIVFRFSSVYGSGRKKTSINLIVDKALKNEKIFVTGDGSQTRDFTHVSDVAEALVMAVEGKFPRGVYNIGTGKSTSINQLIIIIEQILGYSCTPPSTRLAVKYTEKSKGDPLKNDFNVDKVESYGFKAKVSLKEGVKKLIDEMKSESS